MMTMTISIFGDNTTLLTSRSDPDMEVEYYTALQHGNFTVYLLHCSQGIGMSDRYYYRTVLEVYKNDVYYTDKLADLFWINTPIETNESINIIMKWVYNNSNA
jgi:hypothetical protein